MFVPIHARRRGAAGGNAQVRSKRATLVAILGVVTTAMVSNVVRAGARGTDGGIGTAIGLAIGIGAAALGLALARAVGRQGKA
jgi:hypothetical protein